jgi:hypothetical protein
MGGFEVDAKMPAIEAYKRFRDQRLHRRPDGQLAGNIIVNARGEQHRLDNHSSFQRRIQDYIVGRNCLALVRASEIDLGRAETMDVLCDVFKKRARQPIELITRFGRRLTESQALQIRSWLHSIKKRA